MINRNKYKVQIQTIATIIDYGKIKKQNIGKENPRLDEDFDEVLERRPYTNGWLVNSGDLLVETNEIFSVSISRFTCGMQFL